MKQKLFRLFALLIMSSSIGLGWLWMDFKGFINNRADIPAEGLDIEIATGDTFASVSQNLYRNGIVRSVFYLRIAGRLYPELTHLKRGEYQLDATMTPRDIFTKLVSGKVKTYEIRFIEGWKLSDFVATLAAETKLVQTLQTADPQQLSAAFSLEVANPEGWFYPDTYQYVKGATDMDILEVAHDKMKGILDQYWQERDVGLPYNNPYEVLIMASIIEKETGLEGERDRIAGVFVRRLQKNMRLQTDPTVIYGLGSEFDGNLKKKHLRQDNIYNTYRNKGLPPTPIAMPSEASIKAAVHPAGGTELYFVARGDGSHQFSTTLDEHNRAVRQYQLKQQQ